MWYECSECGARVEQTRAPVYCAECGTAGVIFVEAEDSDEENESTFAAWIELGGWRDRKGLATYYR